MHILRAIKIYEKIKWIEYKIKLNNTKKLKCSYQL